jgi:phage shock protein PspC (stress-responsive transcriptional regulator)
MFCTHCGAALHAESDRYCASCGHRTPQGAEERFYPRRRLVRPSREKRIGGVCAGIAQYLDVDVTLIRILSVIGLIFSAGTALIAYVIAWIILPPEAPRPVPDGCAASARL